MVNQLGLHWMNAPCLKGQENKETGLQYLEPVGETHGIVFTSTFISWIWATEKV